MAIPYHKQKQNRDLKILAAAFIAMCLGYYLLNHVATWEEEDRKLGAVFYIITGCILMAVSFIVIAALVRRKYFPSKKKKKSRPVFLDDTTMKRDKNT